MKLSSIFLFVFAIFLSGCFQEDPQVQQLRDERDAAMAKAKNLEETVSKLQASGSNSSGNASVLQKQVDDLKGQLEIAQAEVKKAKEYTPEVMSEEELLIRLRTATTAHREAIRERFDVQNLVLTDFSMPEKLTHPYRCGVQYDLIEKSTGDPYHLDVNVRAPLSGKWIIPPVQEFATKIKKGVRVAVASTNQGAGQQAPAPGQPTGGIVQAGGKGPSNPSNPSGAIVTYPGNNPVGLPGGGGGQPPVTSGGQPAVTSGGQPPVTSGGQPAVTSGGQQPQQPARPAPRGPGMAVTRDIKVNW